jgi:hypothetical protein
LQNLEQNGNHNDSKGEDNQMEHDAAATADEKERGSGDQD